MWTAGRVRWGFPVPLAAPHPLQPLFGPRGVAERITDEAAFVARAPPKLRERLLVVPFMTHEIFHMYSSCESAQISHCSCIRLAARFTIWHLATEITTVATRRCPIRKRARVRLYDQHEHRRLGRARPEMLESPAINEVHRQSACVPAPPEYDRRRV